MELAEKFKLMAMASKDAIEDFNDFAEDRATSWAFDEITRLTAAVESLTALCEKQQKIVDAQAYDLKDRNATIDRYVESAARDRAQVASLTAEKEAADVALREAESGLAARVHKSLNTDIDQLVSSLAQAREEIAYLKETDAIAGRALKKLSDLAEAAEQREKGLVEHQAAMAPQIYRALGMLGAPPELLAIIGSWGDCLSDEDVLEFITTYNENGTCVGEMLVSVYDTPQDRRDRFKLVYKAALAAASKEKANV